MVDDGGSHQLHEAYPPFDAAKEGLSAMTERRALGKTGGAAIELAGAAVRQPESDDRDFIEIHNTNKTPSDSVVRAIYNLSLMAAVNGGGGKHPLVSPNGALDDPELVQQYHNSGR